MRIRIMATAAAATLLVACSGGNSAGNGGGTTAGSNAGNGSTSSGTTTGGAGTTGGASTTSGTTTSGTTTGGSSTSATTTGGTTTSGTSTSGSTTGGSTTGSTTGTTGAGIGCSPGHYDLDGQSANGCEVTCDATGCHNSNGQTVPNPGFAAGSQFSNFGALSEGSNLSGPRSGTNFRSVGRVGAPEVGPAMSGSSFKSQGGLISN